MIRYSLKLYDFLGHFVKVALNNETCLPVQEMWV